MTRRITVELPKVGGGSDKNAPFPAAGPNRESLDLSVVLVTPLFGGGVAPGEPGVLTAVSEKGIRGQLRFWWRLTCGAAFPTPEEMNVSETEVFGDGVSPSPLQVKVLDVKLASPPTRHLSKKDCYGFSKFGPEAYALFPATNNKIPSLIKEGLSFRVMLSWPTKSAMAVRRLPENEARRRGRLPPLSDRDISRDVKTAAWAWLNFGGYGSRTRRGCGALFCRNLSVRASADNSNLMPGALLLGPASRGRAAALRAWGDALSVYKKFRQVEFRNQGHDGQPKRSRWPEADSVRAITNCKLDKGPGRQHTMCAAPFATIPGFPRAALGLPIIFHFKDGPKADRGEPPQPKLDPPDATLVPHLPIGGGLVYRDRMASPVITRPLFVDGHWVPAVFVLPRPYEDRLEARLDTQRVVNDATGKPNVEPHERTIPHDWIIDNKFHRLESMPTSECAVEAFQAYVLKQNGWVSLSGVRM